MSDYVQGLHIDFTETEQAIETILAESKKSKFTGIVGTDDTTTELAAKVAMKLSLPHNNPQAVKIAQRKDFARNCLKKSNVKIPKFDLLSTTKPLAEQEIKVSFPAVIKPVALSASRGVIRVNNSEELEQAAHALDDFASYLKNTLAQNAKGDFARGRNYFDLILQERHFLNINADELYSFGEKLFSETEKELKKVTQELQGNEDVDALMKKIQHQRPKKENVLDEYRKQMLAARKFVEDNDIVSMPAKEALKVVEPPGFLQHQIPFAAYYEPSPADVNQQGYYYVTPAKTEDELGDHNNISLKHTCVH
ncbi:MAG: DUF885 family protein [Kangiellaceae bacterium]|nr:DUF885 family protein [Kangiellaceae bacterium]